LEILRAASRVAGTEASGLTDHDNLIQFKVGDGEFPDLDNVMTWIFHVTYRKKQRAALRSELGLLAERFLERPAHPNELKAAEAAFSEIISAEERIAEAWKGGPEDRSMFRRMVSWTTAFHPAFMRELACAEVLRREPGPGVVLTDLRRPTWYFPVLDRPAWTAWGVVLELALRRMLVTWCGEPKRWAEICPEVQPGLGLHPSMVFVRRREGVTSTCSLTLYVEAYEPRWYTPRVRGAFDLQWSWRLPTTDLPWPSKPSVESPVGEFPLPSARELLATAIPSLR
jgi:hypothetical protein